MGNPPTDDFHVRAMRADETGLAVDWAGAEGWKPGLGDAQCFAVVDAGGFLIGEFEGKIRPLAVERVFGVTSLELG